jgi:aminoglycoside phosphotransferase family enzyme/predicted kinase
MAPERTVEQQQRMIEALGRQLAASGESVQLCETHISLVLVSGTHAFKVKKAVRFDFLDFSTLAARRRYCNEELRLNRRLAPTLYLDVIAIHGSEVEPQFGASGEPIEFAVRMRAFPQSALWRRRVLADILCRDEIDQLAEVLARFHGDACCADEASRWGLPSILEQIASENLDALQALAAGPVEAAALRELALWLAGQHGALAAVFVQRWACGAVRECHGDLHLDNIVTMGKSVLAFDCIEFSERLRWIDVIADLAFACMDLAVHGQHGLAARLLNSYLEVTGDYAAMSLFRYYRIQCAMTRWKITLWHARRHTIGDDRGAAIDNRAWAARYMVFALDQARPSGAAIIIMHGYSGSGKSSIAGELVEFLDAVRIRSDVERKRMRKHAKMPALAPTWYDARTTEATYLSLALLASQIARSGNVVVVDATFLLSAQREQFRILAIALAVPFFIVNVKADTPSLVARLQERACGRQGPSDADAEVLMQQQKMAEPLSAAEQASAIEIVNEEDLSPAAIRQACAPIQEALVALRHEQRERL